jgi:hypothetical protein
VAQLLRKHFAIELQTHRNRGAITAKSLRNRRAITAKVLQNHCAIIGQSLCNGSAIFKIVAQSLCNSLCCPCAIDAKAVRIRCLIARNRSEIAMPSLRNRHAITKSFAIAARNRCKVTAQTLQNRFKIASLPLCNHCAVIAQSHRDQLRLFCYRFAIAS